ncbi:aldo/keto reductase family protein [Microbacterium sp. NE2HP2]|uniref:aldo/keto reductase family protein n=1 Tax=Microbacterium TaxID=33882 RepID=UPI0023672B95|nr:MULTISPECIES: aldo/keto reductase family protein [Microbacterium]MDD7944269.1 aldo/keto reductase family protein [Microbacterium plantarum]WHE36601.1 aldo/keto reductase family protein [Microbacterium sp. BDGP8]WRK17844.1 aldo/keto reductase family protein [Microbacterium plantarum]
MVEYRYLGNSGFKVSEITYGNWVTHASQVENDAAIATVHKALDLGITSFDTADAYANTAAEVVLGEALKGQPRETLEIFTKVYWPTGRKGPNDQGLSRKHIFDSINGSLRRLGVDYVDLYQAHRYDYETPLEETMQAFADIVRQGKALYIGVSEWTAEQLREGHALATKLGFQLVSNQPQYSALWRVIEGKVIPASQELGISQIVWSPLAQGVLTGKYQPGQPVPEGSRATDEKSGANFIKRFLNDEVLTAVQKLKPIADEAGLTVAQLSLAWVLHNENIAAALVGASRPEQLEDTVKASGVKLEQSAYDAINDALGGVAVTDPAETDTVSPKTRPA